MGWLQLRFGPLGLAGGVCRCEPFVRQAKRSKRHYWVKRQVIMERNAVALQLALQQWVLGGVIGAIGAVTASAAQAAPLEEFQYNSQTDQLSFVLPDGVTPRYFLMAQPARIVVDIPDTQIGDLPLEQTFAGAVKRVEVTQVQPQLARVILEMSPQAMFARGQVSLQNVGDAAPQKDRWVLKPLLASLPRPGTPTAIAPTAPLVERVARRPARDPAAIGKDRPESIAPTQPVVNPPANPVVVTPPAPIVAAKPAPAVELPPGMESVIGAPSPLPKLATPPTAPAVNRPPVVVPPAAVPIARLPEVASLPDVPPPPPLLQATIINRAPTNPNSPAALITPSPVMRPDRQPSLGGSSPLVSVPPLASIGVPAGTPPPAATTNLPPAPPLPAAVVVTPTLPTLLPGTEPGGSRNRSELPPLPDGSLRGSRPTVIAPAPTPVLIAALPPTASSPTALPVAPAPLQLPATGVVEFGQRLPGTVAVAPNLPTLPNGAYVVALDNLTTGGVVVPAGTMLSLRYDQPTALKLKSGQRQQSLFSLQSPIVDSQGRILAMQGSSVLGEFATSGEGSQFTTQVLAIGNRSLALTAQSDMLKSTKRLSGDRLLQNSGIGAVAGAILGGLNGSVLGGAAAGAAITYAIAPKDTTLQPGQVLQVKLMQDFFAAR